MDWVAILTVVILFLCVLFVPYDNWLNMAARKLASKRKNPKYDGLHDDRYDVSPQFPDGLCIGKRHGEKR